MEAIKLTWYQKRFNKSRGYRGDLQKPFIWYVKDWIKANIVGYFFYTNEVKEGYTERKFINGNLRSVEVPAKKATYGNYKVTFLPSTWIAFSISFNFSVEIFPSYSIAFSLEKPNWQLRLKLQNNTAQ